MTEINANSVANKCIMSPSRVVLVRQQISVDPAPRKGPITPAIFHRRMPRQRPMPQRAVLPLQRTRTNTHTHAHDFNPS